MRLCDVEGCGVIHFGRGFCNAHYMRFMKHGSPLSEKPFTRKLNLNERLDYYTDKTGDCWCWVGAKTKGYGVLEFDGVRWYAHRLSWIRYNGDIPEGLHVLHSCDNPSCVNPKHLSVGTHQQNMKESVERGCSAKGERCGRSKLKNNEVVAIKQLLKDGVTCVKIGGMFNVVPTTIHHIKTGKNWGWLT